MIIARMTVEGVMMLKRNDGNSNTDRGNDDWGIMMIMEIMVGGKCRWAGLEYIMKKW